MKSLKMKEFQRRDRIIYINDFNQKVLTKMIKESDLEFHPIFGLWCLCLSLERGHPLANKEEISIEELEEYPCLAFEQGNYNSFYFAEEVLSTYEYKRLIRANDQATLFKSHGRVECIHTLLWHYM